MPIDQILEGLEFHAIAPVVTSSSIRNPRAQSTRSSLAPEGFAMGHSVEAVRWFSTEAK
jgi:hypothetical protein